MIIHRWNKANKVIFYCLSGFFNLVLFSPTSTGCSFSQLVRRNERMVFFRLVHKTMFTILKTDCSKTPEFPKLDNNIFAPVIVFRQIKE